MRLGNSLLASLLLTTAGCSLFHAGRHLSTAYVPIHEPPHPLPPIPADQVEVFLATIPTRPFIEVAMLEVQEGRGRYTSSELFAGIRELAGRHGCEGLILIGDNDSSGSTSSNTASTETSTTPGTDKPTTTTTTTGTSRSWTDQGYRASCIAFDRAAEAAPSAVRDLQGSCETCSAGAFSSSAR